MEPVSRHLVDDIPLHPSLTIGRVVVRRITMAPHVAAEAHTHNGPVFGVIESGSVRFQVDGGESVTLVAGDTFYEPAHTVINAFDAAEDGVTFLGWFPVGPGDEPRLAAAN